MTGTERRQFEMLVRVRNFGQAHPQLFASSTTAQQTFAAIGAAIDELTTTDGRKIKASASVRDRRKAVTRRALADILRRASILAKNLRAEGRTMPAFRLPASKSNVSLLTAGRQFALDVAPFDAEFSGHEMGTAQLTAVTDAFEAAVNDSAMHRSDHVAARARIRDLLAAAVRGVQRLDLIVANALGHDNVVQAEWTQLRRVEDARVTRGGTSSPEPTAGDTDVTQPDAETAADTPAATLGATA